MSTEYWQWCDSSTGLLMQIGTLEGCLWLNRFRQIASKSGHTGEEHRAEHRAENTHSTIISRPHSACAQHTTAQRVADLYEENKSCTVSHAVPGVDIEQKIQGVGSVLAVCSKIEFHLAFLEGSLEGCTALHLHFGYLLCLGRRTCFLQNK